MARNFIQPGETITLTAPRDVASGDGFMVGGIFAVALAAAKAGARVEARRVGVWDLTKAAGGRGDVERRVVPIELLPLGPRGAGRAIQRAWLRGGGLPPP